MDKSLNADFAAIALAVGTRVEQERTARQLTKEGLAELSGLASRYLWRVEEGMQNITLKNLVAIANGLGLTLEDLLSGVEIMALNPQPRAERKPRGPGAAERR